MNILAQPYMVEDILKSLPPETFVDLANAIRTATREKADVVIVLDDDPTGTQTIYDVPVLTDWSEENIRTELALQTPMFYILTNSRSISREEAQDLAFEIGQNIVKASRATGKRPFVISRSDSTLRGHYPWELDALELGMEIQNGVQIIIPAFFEGGRYTIGDVHFVKREDLLVPASETPFAFDKVFGYRSSNLKEWVEEKTEGFVHAEDVISFSIKELRNGTLHSIVDKLDHCEPGSVCIVNAAAHSDLQTFTLALLMSKIEPVCRSAASFVAALAALPPKNLLTNEELISPNAYGGLIIVGSYVPQTTRQLDHLMANTSMEFLSVDVREILQRRRSVKPLLEQYAAKINRQLESGRDLVVYTSRELIASQAPKENLKIGRKVSDFLTGLVSAIKVRPRYIMTKGGITSSDIAIKSLNVRRGTVIGQVLPGIPVWKLGPESKFPGLSYIIFPGNVGTDDAITQAAGKLLPVHFSI
ncbi:MAG: hypothetical protein KBG02_00145 [Haliscomenobacter sp.]|nr:hypothetical protein [Haliscomenobacter sp.]MBK8652469.1 hypothetical protein [Haliscomenobacter sp.]MBP9075239.1 hypothetical protein [Haliscomenobacter sp.]MBP9872499.1 hypothetical protein [Haliscomenobacter sp.]